MYILTIHAGTTYIKTSLVNHQGEIAATNQKEIFQYYPDHGHVEQNPLEIWQQCIKSIEELLKKSALTSKEILSIGITNQRETIVIWDKKTGNAIWNAIGWQDTRTKTMIDNMESDDLKESIHKKTGLLLSSHFSASKIRWILDHLPSIWESALKGKICAGTIDTYLLWKLTNGHAFKTDVTNASRTLLFNIHELNWDEKLLAIFNIPKEILPEVFPSNHHFGTTSCDIFPTSISIHAILADQQASLFGHTCFSPGEIACTYATGSCVMMNTGKKPFTQNRHLLTTIAWQIDHITTYALEGSIYSGQSVINWLKDSLGLIHDTKEIEGLAASVPDSGGLYFVPALHGIGSPDWNMHALGTIQGISLSTNIGHLARAALEGIAHQITDVICVMEKVTKKEISLMKVGGILSQHNFFLQLQANTMHTKIIRPIEIDRTTLGIAFLTGLASNFWLDLKEIESFWHIDQTFKSEISPSDITLMRKKWKIAVKSSHFWDQHKL